jgi:rfaE bifunctional protein kinase chain/domain
VGTPPGEDGSADLQHVVAAARNIGRHMTDYKIVVDKSTVPVGTADKVRAAITEELAKRGVKVPFAVVSNPEFLKEGAAVEDFMRPDRVVVGSDDQQATHIMRALYAPFQRNHDRLMVMDVRSAELTKYAANAMLATRISFMNELANLAEKLGADIEEVRKGIGSDPRIGYQFLYAGIGYGGSCFPKDVKALIRTAADAGSALPLLDAVESVNAEQKRVLAKKIKKRFGKLAGMRIAVWGLAFKPNTDDARGAEPRAHRGAARRRRGGVRLRPGRDDRGEGRARGPQGRELRRLDARRARWRGRARGGDRVEGVPQPRFRRDQEAPQDAGDLRRAQPVRAGGPEARRPGVLSGGKVAGVKAGDRVFSELGKAKILVVGDVMLDRYWYGEVNRISPEAPVPIVKIDTARSKETPGGAANVAMNAAALGGNVALLSVVGDDEPGKRLAELLESAKVNAYLHRDAEISTTVKLRVIGAHQQMLRVDFETAPSHEVLLDKLADFGHMIADRNVVILSDYGKGGLTHIASMIEVARARGKIVLVDPKGEDYSRYRGATVVTPNRAEMRKVVGSWKNEEELTAKAQKLREDLGLAALLLTRSEEGMTLYEKDKRSHEPARAREVFDVSGAGDTVIATLGVMLGAGAPLHDAMGVANLAGGIVVGKLGTAVVHPQELLAALEQS